MAETRKAYRNTRTDAVRHSTRALGYPYVLVEKSETKESKGNKSSGDDGKSAEG
jgi:hypothetical protein